MHKDSTSVSSALERAGIEKSMEISTAFEKLGVDGSEVWNIMVNQQFYEGMVSLLTLIVITFIYFKLFQWYFNHKHKDEVAQSFKVMGLVVFGIVYFFVCAHLLYEIPAISNPEYYAIKELDNFLK